MKTEINLLSMSRSRRSRINNLITADTIGLQEGIALSFLGALYVSIAVWVISLVQ